MSDPPALSPSALERLERVGGAKLVRSMIELYLANGPDRIRSLTEGAAAGDLDRVERAAHTMKSSAGNLGATRLQQTAGALETVAGAGTIDHDMVARLVREYEESADALRRLLEGEQS